MITRNVSEPGSQDQVCSEIKISHIFQDPPHVSLIVDNENQFVILHDKECYLKLDLKTLVVTKTDYPENSIIWPGAKTYYRFVSDEEAKTLT
jgi:hypothetical protein